MSPFEWIRSKLDSGVSKSALRMMYKVFLKETHSTMKYESYKRVINRIAKKSDQSNTAAPESGTKIKKEVEGPDTTIASESHEIRTLEQLIAYCKVDLTTHYVTKHVVNMWGSATNPSFQVKAWLSLINDESEESEAEIVESLIKKMKTYAPTYPTIIPKKSKSGNALEICLFDHHFGQLSWGKETGSKNYDLKIAAEMAGSAIESIVSSAAHYELDKIIIPIGNDFFNVNDKTNTTVKGTPQDEDARWVKTFDNGCDVWVDILEKLRSIAPVQALWIPGNHDEERSYYLAKYLHGWFHNSDIVIDNTPKPQKVVTWGTNAVMYTHGCNERKNDYPAVFATTFPQEFAKAKYRAIHLGDKHHLNKSSLTANEDVYSIDVKIKPALVPLNAWSAGKAYRAIARTEAEIWNKKDGLIADLYYNDL